MTILQSLKFTQGAIAKHDFIPSLTHFRICNGTVRGFNGNLAICAPIALDFDIAPIALPFIKAVDSCKDVVSLHVAKNGKLVISSGKFTAHLECLDPSTYPMIKPEGKLIKLSNPILPALKILEPFVASDASRPWACGILFNGESAYATNNVILVEYWMGFDFPHQMNIPAATVKELIRINEEPSKLQVSENRVIFHYGDGRWVSTQVLAQNWPDLNDLLNQHLNAEAIEPPEGLWNAIEQILPFSNEMNAVHFNGNCISTIAEADAEAGARVNIKCPDRGCFNGKLLLTIGKITKTISFDSWPKPVAFFGDNCRGIIAGINTK